MAGSWLKTRCKSISLKFWVKFQTCIIEDKNIKDYSFFVQTFPKCRRKSQKASTQKVQRSTWILNVSLFSMAVSVLPKLSTVFYRKWRRERENTFQYSQQEFSFNDGKHCYVENCQKLKFTARVAAFDQERNKRMWVCKTGTLRGLQCNRLFFHLVCCWGILPPVSISKTSMNPLLFPFLPGKWTGSSRIIYLYFFFSFFSNCSCYLKFKLHRFLFYLSSDFWQLCACTYLTIQNSLSHSYCEPDTSLSYLIC